MKKIFNFALLFAAACTVSVNLTSCSSDDDKPMISITEQNDAIKALSTDLSERRGLPYLQQLG